MRRSSPLRARRRRLAAFTLVELILVMALTVCVLALVAPRLDLFSRGQMLTSQADAVLSLLRSGRDRAAAEGAVYRVEVDADAHACRLLTQQGGQFVAPEVSISDREVRMTQGVSIEVERFDGQDGLSYVDLLPTGACTPARISLKDGAGNALYVACRTALEPFIVTDRLEDSQP